MASEQQIDEAFASWWRDFNADSDENPGPSHLARAAFRAGCLKASALSSLQPWAPAEGSTRDVYEVANQLGGYVGPNTEERLAKFLLRESDEAAKLADEIVRLRAIS